VTELILYSRSYCHLCDDLLQALNAAFAERYRYTVTVVDVDHDPALVAQYDELVPVLVANSAGGVTELCHYFLDEAAVGAYLRADRPA
jgi:hypothetical protein